MCKNYITLENIWIYRVAPATVNLKHVKFVLLRMFFWIRIIKSDRFIIPRGVFERERERKKKRKMQKKNQLTNEQIYCSFSIESKFERLFFYFVLTWSSLILRASRDFFAAWLFRLRLSKYFSSFCSSGIGFFSLLGLLWRVFMPFVVTKWRFMAPVLLW